MPEHPTDLAGTFALLARDLFARQSVDDTLEHISRLAVTTIRGCDHAGVWVLHGGEIAREIRTDPLVGDVDHAQLEVDEGPCLDALRGTDVVLVDDTERDDRYPRFGSRAAAAGVGTVLSQRLVVGEEPFGSLNLYGDSANAFDDAARDTARLFAAHTGIVLAAARARDDAAREEEGLRTALTSRDVIGQAKGILMERQKVTADEAFDILRRTSQGLNVKLRELAQRLAETGELPS
ncbi:MAG: GAF and ANTAR domain-containing protein [Acidimicrobiia bacterium]|nr:GAF and ANTAR domain-containing protein [Acidimicrobiia bacterium]